jgi:malonyl-CoA O-methyltransferase
MTDNHQRVPLLEVEEAYARWAASYPPQAHNPLMRAEERAMLSLLPGDLHGHAVLDAGCGTGRYTLEALRRGAAHVIGVDFSAQMLARAGTELVHATGSAAAVTLLRASLGALPLRARWADLTICGLTLGHLPALEPCVAELKRVTRPGGRIVCSDFHPLAHAGGARREFSAGGQRYAVRHTPHSGEDWRQACKTLGLRIVRLLEPRLEAADLRDHQPPDSRALEMPVVMVLELAYASGS